VTAVEDRHARLRAARLYLVCPDLDPDRLRGALRGGVDLVQLRMKDAADDAILRAAGPFREACDEAGALFVLNDRPDLVEATGADGVHVGQDDAGVSDARAAVGPDRIVGVSTHAPDDLEAAADDGADYAGVGPVHATPTKPGREAVGLDYVRHAAASARLPWFAIGGVDAVTVAHVAAAGATRIAVVRAITEADDPEAAARVLRSALDAPEHAGLGRA
jgi:thiamine-phosphate pyrophosphorylase